MKKLSLLALVGVMVLAFGCSKHTQAPKNSFQNDLADAPAWVMQGCAAFTGEKGKMICGLGSMEGTNNLSLCRSAAKERARVDLARDYDTAVRGMFKTYQANIGNVAGAGEDEQMVIDTAINLTKTNIRGTKLVGQWISGDGRCFALISLDAQAFLDNLNQMENLSAKQRELITKHANDSWDELVTLTQEN